MFTEINKGLSTNTSLSKNTSVKLEKMKLPTFSGDIRHFARFQSDFESIVKPAYQDTLHQIYVLK